MKKIICIALSAILLTACHAEEKEEQVTGTSETTATTPLTLTEIVTEELPFIPEESEEKREVIELAAFNPFEDSVAVEDEVYRELSEAVEKISNGYALLCNPPAFHTGECCRSKYYDNYADTNVILEEDEKQLYQFYPLNPEIAETEEELFLNTRKIFTENMYSDNEIMERLFIPLTNDNQPAYKTIDGKLCIKHQIESGANTICFTQLNIIEYSEKYARLSTRIQTIDYPSLLGFMTLVKSEEYGWQMDSIEYEGYWETEATLLYNGLKLREEQINKILNGGVTPDNPRTKVVEGIEFTETNVGMNLGEMQDFFSETFTEKVIECDAYMNETVTQKPLCDEYIIKYINKVYMETNGVLYRRNDAPKWYLPELKIDVTENFYKQSFADKDGEIKTNVVIDDERDIDEETGELVYYTLRIASELPIKTLE